MSTVRKYQRVPPLRTTAFAVPPARALVSSAQCSEYGEQALPVMSAAVAAVISTAFFRCVATRWTANATDETGRSTMTSTPSTSYQRPAICEPTSGLVRWSAETTEIFLPPTDPPKPSTASSTAATEPGQ